MGALAGTCTFSEVRRIIGHLATTIRRGLGTPRHPQLRGYSGGREAPRARGNQCRYLVCGDGW
jgi:hypothetical protein